MELGIFSLSDLQLDKTTGRRVPAVDRISETLGYAQLADTLGLDLFALGEHHSLGFAVSSPAVVLTAIAARTTSIRLTSTVTVLSALDPVRAYQDFATLDLISHGRAEMIVGRSAFIEPFELFGIDTADYDAIFAEKLDLLLRARSEPTISWKGRFRPPISEAQISPRALQEPLPVWVGVGGTPASAQRAGRLGLPMVLGLIGGTIAQARRTIDIYRDAGEKAGHQDRLRVGISTHFYAGTPPTAAREVFVYYHEYLRPKTPGGRGLVVDRASFEAGTAPWNALMIGSSDELIVKLMHAHEVLGVDRVFGQIDWGGLPSGMEVPGVALAGQGVDIDLGRVSAEIEKVVVAAVQDDADPAPLSAVPLTVAVDPGEMQVPMAGLSSERAVVLIELYRRADQWKIRSISAGWTEGFTALILAHGVDVADEDKADQIPVEPAVPVVPVPPSAPPASGGAPSLNLRKPGVDAVDLGKRTGTINLRKGQQVTISKTARIVAASTWPRATDYDIFALVRYRDGHTETVSTFGTQENKSDFRLMTSDQAVRHSGDVGRAQSKGWRKKTTSELGQETIEISLKADILAVVPVVYSAQSNGTGSFRRYQVAMAIDNGGGDTVTIAADDASDEDGIFSCVPGIIINDPDGVRIQFLEFYSAAGSEERPIVGDDLIVTMDAGPTNAFK